MNCGLLVQSVAFFSHTLSLFTVFYSNCIWLSCFNPRLTKLVCFTVKKKKKKKEPGPKEVAMVVNSYRIVVIGFQNESKVIQIDFCKEGELVGLLEQLAIEYNTKSKDIFLVSPAKADQELRPAKCLIGLFFFFPSSSTS